MAATSTIREGTEAAGHESSYTTNLIATESATAGNESMATSKKKVSTSETTDTKKAVWR